MRQYDLADAVEEVLARSRSRASFRKVDGSHTLVPFVEPRRRDAECSGEAEAGIKEGAANPVHNAFDPTPIEASAPRERGDGKRLTGFMVPEDKCKESVTFGWERRRSSSRRASDERRKRKARP